MVDAKGSSLVATIEVEVAHQVGNEDGQGNETSADAVENKTRIRKWVIVLNDEHVFVVGFGRLDGGRSTEACSGRLENAAQAGGDSQEEDDYAKGDVDGKKAGSVIGGATLTAKQHKEGDEAKEELQKGKKSKGRYGEGNYNYGQ